MKVIEVLLDYLTNLPMAIKVTGVYFIVWFTIVIGGKVSKIGTFFKVDEPKTGFQKLKRWLSTVGYRILSLMLNIGLMFLIGALIVAILFWLVQERVGIVL